MYEISLAFVLTLMLTTAIFALVYRYLLVSIAMFGIYSLSTVLLFVLLDAVDVAFTEAAVGGGFSLILFLSCLALVRHDQKSRIAAPLRFELIPALMSVMFVALLVYGTLPLPEVGDSNSPANTHTGLYYLLRSPQDIDVPNVVTSVLASYRGFDTMGEVAVIFCSALGVMGLLAKD